MKLVSKDVRFNSILKPADYEKEYIYWPWGIIISKTINYINQNAPVSSTIVDYMCGTGYLLNEIKIKRPDLNLIGYNLYPKSYIRYAKRKYKHIAFYNCNVLNIKIASQPKIIVLTGGLHHLNKTYKAKLIEKIASELNQGSLLLLGEEVIEKYNTETERKIAIVDLHLSLIKYIINCDSPDFIQQEALKIYYNDYFQRAEYKISLQEIDSITAPFFNLLRRFKTWPCDKSPFGNYLSVYQRK